MHREPIATLKEEEISDTAEIRYKAYSENHYTNGQQVTAQRYTDQQWEK